METPLIPLNPITHVVNGTKKLLKTNIWQLVTLWVIQILFGVGTAVLMMLLLGSKLSSYGDASLRGQDIAELVVSGLAFVAIMLIVGTLVSLTVTRLVLSGVRNNVITIGDALQFALTRIWLYIELGVLFVGGLIAAGVVLALVSVVLGPLGTVLTILAVVAGIVAAIIFVPTFALLPFILVEDEKPAGPVALFKAARAAAKPIYGKIWALVGLSVVIMVILSPMAGNSTPNATVGDPAPTGRYLRNSMGEPRNELRPASLISNAISGVVTLLMIAGTAEVYTRAHDTKGKAKSDTKEAAKTASDV